MTILGLNSPEIFLILLIVLVILGNKRIEKFLNFLPKLLKFLLSDKKSIFDAETDIYIQKEKSSEEKRTKSIPKSKEVDIKRIKSEKTLQSSEEKSNKSTNKSKKVDIKQINSGKTVKTPGLNKVKPVKTIDSNELNGGDANSPKTNKLSVSNDVKLDKIKDGEIKDSKPTKVIKSSTVKRKKLDKNKEVKAKEINNSKTTKSTLLKKVEPVNGIGANEISEIDTKAVKTNKSSNSKKIKSVKDNQNEIKDDNTPRELKVTKSKNVELNES